MEEPVDRLFERRRDIVDMDASETFLHQKGSRLATGLDPVTPG